MATKDKDKDIKVRKGLRTLPVTLTDEEQKQKAQQLADTVRDLKNHEDYEADVKQTLKAKKTALIAEQSRVASIVSSGVEMRDVSIETQFDYKRLTVTTLRTDTGEQLDIRDMTEDEKQIELFEREKEEKAEAERAEKPKRRRKAR